MPLPWQYEAFLSNYEASILYSALEKYPDTYHYKPVSVAKRDETGIKYHYLCIAFPKDNPFISSHFADIEVYKPPTGAPYVTYQKRIGFDPLASHDISD